MCRPLPNIGHLDADAFFVSCELARQPELQGRRCAVGGRKRGIISSASYEARAAGVDTPMPTQRALRVCPDLILLPHTAGLYGRMSTQMFALVEAVTPMVERASIDEGYFDVAPCGDVTLGRLTERVQRLQQSIRATLGLPVSIGLATNKMVAQIASKLRKPNGFVVVAPGAEATFLAPLSVDRLPGIGPRTAAALQTRHGINTVGELATRSDRVLRSLFGARAGDLRAMARGEGDSRVEAEPHDARSYSQQETFARNLDDFDAVLRIAKGMVEELLVKVRADGKHVRTMTVKVRHPDFSEVSHGRSLRTATDLEAPFYDLLPALLRAAWRSPRPLRLVAVRLSGVEEQARQLEMFAGSDERRRRLAGVLDRLNAAGSQAVVRRGHQLAIKTEEA